MSTPFRIAVLASTNGTDLQAIIDAIRSGNLHAELTCVVSNKKNCFALERARAQGFAAYFVDAKNKKREAYDQELFTLLQKNNIGLIWIHSMNKKTEGLPMIMQPAGSVRPNTAASQKNIMPTGKC